MAQLVLTNAKVTLDSNDISAYIKSVKINFSKELQDSTVMGNTSKARLSGLADWSIELEFNQDYAASAIDSIIWPIVSGSTAKLIEVLAVNTTVSSSNPKYSGTGLIDGYNPIQGSVGEVAQSSITIMGSNGVALARATS